MRQAERVVNVVIACTYMVRQAQPGVLESVESWASAMVCWVYFSFSTQTLVGYGDITSVSTLTLILTLSFFTLSVCSYY